MASLPSVVGYSMPFPIVREYQAYLAWCGFDPCHPPEPISILGVTEGRRETDALELFPCPLPGEDGRYSNKFFVHGVRWMPEAAIKRIVQLQRGEPLGLLPDIANPHDRDAVALSNLHGDRFLLGHVPRYLARDVRSILRAGDADDIQVTVECINADAPLQHRLLCSMQSRWPDGFRPCSDESFEPIAKD